MRIGIVLPIGQEDGMAAPPSYREIREVALEAEAAGLDSIWVYDHLLFRFHGETTGNPRVLDDPGRGRGGDAAGPARHARHVHGLSQPGPAREDGRDAR